MTIVNQVGSLPMTGGDVSFKNYGASASIASGQAVVTDTGAGNTMGVLDIATSAGVTNTLGVTMESIAAGKTGRVRLAGGAVCTSNDTLAAGDAVQIDSTSGHEGQVKKCGAATRQLGIALHAAVAGDPVLVWINVANNA